MKYEEFEYYMIAYNEENAYILNFDVYEIAGHDDDGKGEYNVPLYGKGFSEDVSHGEKFMYGSIKWDGCSNWSFHKESCMAHFCGRKSATGIGRLMDRMYQITKENLSTYDVSVAE